MKLFSNIILGDTLVLQEIDDKSVIVEDEVSEINKNNELFFSIRTKNYDYDFLNFYKIIQIKNSTKCLNIK